MGQRYAERLEQILADAKARQEAEAQQREAEPEPSPPLSKAESLAWRLRSIGTLMTVEQKATGLIFSVRTRCVPRYDETIIRIEVSNKSPLYRPEAIELAVEGDGKVRGAELFIESGERMASVADFTTDVIRSGYLKFAHKVLHASQFSLTERL